MNSALGVAKVPEVSDNICSSICEQPLLTTMDAYLYCSGTLNLYQPSEPQTQEDNIISDRFKLHELDPT